MLKRDAFCVHANHAQMVVHDLMRVHRVAGRGRLRPSLRWDRTMISRLLSVALMLAGSAAAEPLASAPQQRQAVVDLAYVLGEAHALHRLCAGPDDNTWRGRMARLVEVEAPAAPYRARLMQSFNAGYVARQAQYLTCSDKAAAAEREAATKGRALARHLSTGESP